MSDKHGTVRASEMTIEGMMLDLVLAVRQEYRGAISLGKYERRYNAIFAEARRRDAAHAATWQPVEVQPPQHVREYIEQAMEGEYTPEELRFVLYNDTQAHDWLHSDAALADLADHAEAQQQRTAELEAQLAMAKVEIDTAQDLAARWEAAERAADNVCSKLKNQLEELRRRHAAPTSPEPIAQEALRKVTGYE